jgi:histidinol-phosphate aminotransferase
MRTFSKAYGMAGARVGYAIGHPDTIQAFGKIRNHFGVSRISQAGALAALEDEDWVRSVLTRVAEARQRIAEIGRANGLPPLPSAANFVALDCGADGDFARAVLAGLVDEAIFVRMPFVQPQDRCIRVSCGTPSDLSKLAGALPRAISAAQAGAA